MITRVQVLNYIIKNYDVENYLEIGVNRGKCFFNIIGAKNRYAVDPYFNFSFIKKIRYLYKNPHNFKNKFFEMTSDQFFEDHHTLLKKNPINLTFIDGLHTYQQSLKDTLNALKYSSEKGVIILHDCNPLDKIAAYPAANIEEARIKLSSHKNWKNIWNGDVWKTIVFLRKNHPELTVSVLDTDHDRSRRYTAYDFSKSYLQGLDNNNPILFVYGDNDTYPLWALQETEEFRSDAKVVNFTLLGTAWYIDQVQRRTYKAPGIPSSLNHEEYRDGVNDQVILLSRDFWKQIFDNIPADSIPPNIAEFKKFAVKDSLTAKEAINFLKNKKDQAAIKELYTYFTERDYRDTDVGFIPVNKICLPVNKDNALKYGIVKPEDSSLMVNTVVLKINKQALYKDGLAMLDLLANYNWDRSIYFSSGGTYSQSNIMFAQNYLEYQGVVSKLVPIYTPENSSGEQGRINPNTLYQLVMNYKFGNLKDPKAYFDETCRSNVLNYRMSCGRAAIALAKSGDKKRANDILELVNKEIPLNMYPATPSYNSIISGYFLIGKENEGLKLANAYKDQIAKELNYYLSLSPHDQVFASDDMNKLSSYYTLIVDNIVNTYLELNQKDKALAYITESLKPLDKRLKIFEMLGKNNAKDQKLSLQNLMYSYGQILQVLHPIDSMYEKEKAEEISNIMMKLE